MNVETINGVVVLDYKILADPHSDLDTAITQSLGSTPSSLGVVFVKNIPNLSTLRLSLLKTASKFASLPDHAKESVVFEDNNYMNGWSHGKEIMNGKKDVAKGSFYNNPIYNTPPTEDPEYRVKHPEYGYPNIWPSKSCPEMETEFMEVI